MKYFTVEKETMNVAPTIYPVNASGEQSADALGKRLCAGVGDWLLCE